MRSDAKIKFQKPKAQTSEATGINEIDRIYVKSQQYEDTIAIFSHIINHKMYKQKQSLLQIRPHHNVSSTSKFLYPTLIQRHVFAGYVLKSVDKGMITFLFVILMFRALQLFYIVYSQQCFFLFCWKGQADSMLLTC